ncbi:hypothetical protein Zmor_007883 [Zophobas morio]|uniref:7tm 6 domain containing protein n=1 Tax=Zophobas morio TaxID=2755281 RepID=A0AA38J173_9CUCU|nr:hypothetical protein Zmor_007883 [Zophobas morio]
MEHFHWKLTIRTNLFVLRMLGLWPKDNDKYEFNLYLFYALVVICFFAVFHTLTQAMRITSSLLTELLGLLKIYFFTRNIQIVKQLLTTLDRKSFQPRTVQQKVLIEKDLKLWTQMYFTLSLCGIGALLFWVIFPILDGSYREGQLPFIAWYPFDFEVTPVYQITYIYQILSTSIVAISTINIDTLIAATNLFAGAQFDILCDNLKNLNLGEDDSKYKGKLKICFQHHQQILSFGKSTNKFLNWIVFFEFFTSAVSIGLVMFELTIISPFSSEFYSTISYGGALTVETFTYCWYGNELTLKSSNLAYAIFEAEWTMANGGVKRLITLVNKI